MQIFAMGDPNAEKTAFLDAKYREISPFTCHSAHSLRNRKSAQVNGVGQRPYLGWSTYSQQTITPTQTFLTQDSIIAQSDALRKSGLQPHGYIYINVDADWTGASDAYGRTLFDTTRFPDVVAMIQHIHANGQKFGMYLNPGVGTDQVAANKPILGTPYHLQDIIVKPATIANAFGGGDKIDLHKARSAGVHQLGCRPLRLVGGGLHQTRRCDAGLL
jgi:hypothetical protein